MSNRFNKHISKRPRGGQSVRGGKRSEQSIKSELRHLGVRPNKQRGQNFVIDPSVIDAIVQFSPPLPTEDIVELGPGLGALTEKLGGGRSLTLVELQAEFCGPLKERFPTAEIINTDAREFDFNSLDKQVAVFGNLPYVHSTAIIFQILSFPKVVTRAVLLLQKEFSERVAASPGGRDYGVLSVMAQILCTARLGPIICGDRFHPPTKVDSRVLEISFRESPLIPEEELAWFKKTVKAAFNQRRKMLRNSLRSSGYLDSEQIERGLSAANIDGARRAETLSIEEFRQLALCLAS